MQPMPSRSMTSSRSTSIQRLSSEYDGWWMSSGVPSAPHDRRRLERALGGVRRDPGVQRLALAHRGVERAHRLLERRLGVDAVGVEDVDVVEAHAPEALIEARQQVLARAPVPVGPGPHVVAGLAGDDQLVAVGAQVVAHDQPERALRGPVGRAVVVGEVEVRDPAVERAPDDRARGLERPVGAEVVPQPERDRGQLDAAAAAAAVGHPAVVAVLGRDVGHDASCAGNRPPRIVAAIALDSSR